ncbi:carbohydrate ABC transporter permease [Protaetiibacter mangrovi]|uniref:Carbohydrate ABC transporter permease n=1 Tax=Protaetiibacter mangrovi TaxID=2970926 RepID=A0ABT1ZGR2_9MICO|nr:carbohydrate ABC transporter permease [Protaetiibacter mangrovi]MCS0499887.1 carbohydrate ABC transporter permease [Protaetiibacter mangrovi]
MSGILLVIVTLIILLPVFYMLVSSVRTTADLGENPLGFPDPIAWGNYGDVFASLDYGRAIFNTALVALSSVALVVVTGSAAGWAIARHIRGWTKATYRLFIAGLTIPVFVLTTPLYLLMHTLHLLDTYLAAILVYASFNLPFAILFYVSFLRSIPQELEDAAAIDGCGPLKTFWHVVFPLLRPATATIAIFVTLSIWNDVVVPLLFLTSGGVRTVTLSVFQFVGTQNSIAAAQLFPAVVLAAAPLIVLFIIFQRQIIGGITAGIGKS